MRDAMVFAGEFTDLRSRGIHQALALLLVLGTLAGVLVLGVELVKAVQAESLRRAAWLILGAGIGLLMLAPLPLVTSVTISSPAVQCGRPLLSRPDIQRDLQQGAMSTAAENCVRAFSHNRTKSGAILLVSTLLAVIAIGLFALDRARHRPRSSRLDARAVEGSVPLMQLP
jgi:hypothetical protein